MLFWFGAAAVALASLPWGPQHNGGPCPVPDWRLQNSTEACWSVGRQRALVYVGANNSAQGGDGPARLQGGGDVDVASLVDPAAVACVALPWRRWDDPAATGMLIYDNNATGAAVPLRWRMENVSSSPQVKLHSVRPPSVEYPMTSSRTCKHKDRTAGQHGHLTDAMPLNKLVCPRGFPVHLSFGGIPFVFVFLRFLFFFSVSLLH